MKRGIFIKLLECNNLFVSIAIVLFIGFSSFQKLNVPKKQIDSKGESNCSCKDLEGKWALTRTNRNGLFIIGHAYPKVIFYPKSNELIIVDREGQHKFIYTCDSAINVEINSNEYRYMKFPSEKMYFNVLFQDDGMKKLELKNSDESEINIFIQDEVWN